MFFEAIDEIVLELEKIEKHTKSLKLQTIEFKNEAHKLIPDNSSKFYTKELCDLLRDILRERNGAALQILLKKMKNYI